MANTRWSADQTIRAGEGLHPLAIQHRAVLEPRLSAGFIDGLAADTASLRGLSSGKAAARSVRSSATISQNEAVKQGGALAVNIRKLLRTGAPTNKALARAFGVGLAVNNTVGSVAKALQTILGAAAQHEVAAREAGVLPEDVAQARTLWSAVASADASQEGKKLTAKQATAASGALQRRLEDNLVHLVAIAEISLASPPAQHFDALTPRSPAPKKRPATG